MIQRRNVCISASPEVAQALDELKEKTQLNASTLVSYMILMTYSNGDLSNELVKAALLKMSKEELIRIMPNMTFQIKRALANVLEEQEQGTVDQQDYKWEGHSLEECIKIAKTRWIDNA